MEFKVKGTDFTDDFKVQQDLNFLLTRAMKAGSCNFASERDTGASSNSIVAIAFGGQGLGDQVMPSDLSDLNACIRAYENLPEHRKGGAALEAINRAHLGMNGKPPVKEF